MQLGRVLPKLPRDKIIVQNQGCPSLKCQSFLRTFETSMKYLELRHVDLLSLHGINNRQLLEYALQRMGAWPQRSCSVGDGRPGS
jgi:predicted aldo/keto reductase-like oxidoreductase